MPGGPKDESDLSDIGAFSREELLEARVRLEHQISELNYKAIIGGLTPSAKPALLRRLKQIQAEIDRKLAEMGP